MLHLELSIFRLPISHFITCSFSFVQSLTVTKKAEFSLSLVIQGWLLGMDMGWVSWGSFQPCFAGVCGASLALWPSWSWAALWKWITDGRTRQLLPCFGNEDVKFHLCTSGSSSDGLWGKAYPQEFSQGPSIGQSTECSDHSTEILFNGPQPGKQLISCAFYPYPFSVLHIAEGERKLQGYEV